MYTNTSGNYCTAVGYKALYTNNADGNTGIGHQAGTSNTSGIQNTFVGSQCAVPNTTGSYNSALGGNAFATNTTGSSNTAMGYGALNSNTSASANTCIGYQAGTSGNGGSFGGNVMVGYSAGQAATTGDSNVLLGTQAGYYTGSGGANITTGAGNMIVGAYATVGTATDNYSFVVGYAAVGKGTSTGFISPNSGGSVYQGNNSATWAITSDQRLKKNIVDNNIGLDKITQIQVRNFEYRLPTEVTDLPQNQAIKKEGVQLGVIAQELQQVLPECVKTESTGVMSVDPDNLTWYMINAIKELKAEVDSLKQQLASR
jgi:hypothetical protein